MGIAQTESKPCEPGVSSKRLSWGGGNVEKEDKPGHPLTENPALGSQPLGNLGKSLNFVLPL